MSEKPADKTSTVREPKDLRLRNQYFPDAEKLVFHRKKAFVPQPIIMRKLLRYLTPPEVRVLVYLQTRCSQYFICYPILEEMAHDLGLAGTRNLKPLIRSLVQKRFISTNGGGGKTFFLVHDPRVAVVHLVETGVINEAGLFEINDVLKDLTEDEIAATRKLQPVTVVPKARKTG
jgi:hypothetical protein